MTNIIIISILPEGKFNGISREKKTLYIHTFITKAHSIPIYVMCSFVDPLINDDKVWTKIITSLFYV